jgi:hypothetical protein
MKYSFSESEIITPLSGNIEFPFHVHKDLLLHSGSKFFAACLDKFSEAQSNVVKLPDDKTSIARVFIDRLYSGEGKVSFERSRSLGLRIYKFGDKILAEHFCNVIVDEGRAIYRTNKQQISARLLCEAETNICNTPYYAFGLETIVKYMKKSPSR